MPYRKRTRLWNNIEAWTPRPLCMKDCGHMSGNVHEQSAQQSPQRHLLSVRRTTEIINYFNPTYWMMENPQTGLLKCQGVVSDLPYNDLDYCKYGMPYRKRTRLWNNIEAWTPKPLCKKDCDHMVGNRHEQSAQQSPHRHLLSVRRRYLTRELYKVPEALIEELFGPLLQPALPA